MNDIQRKITRHTQKQGNIICNEENNQSIETDPKLTQTCQTWELA